MERKGFIGGSDCVQIMQGNWLPLWRVKTGFDEPEDLSDNIAVQMGIWTESFNLRWFEKQYDCSVKERQFEMHSVKGKVPCKATIDGTWQGAVIEAKHTNAYNSMEKVIEYYMPQVQFYIHMLAVANGSCHGAHLSVIFGNNKWESAFVSADNDYFDSMWAVVSDFWSYVESNTPPPEASGIKPLNTDKIAVDNMVKRDANRDNQFIMSANDYINNQVSAGAFESAKKDLKAMVGDNEREVYSDILSIKRSKNGALRFSQ